MATQDLMNAMRVATSRFDMDWGDEVAGMRSGIIRVRQRRPDLWKASFSIEQMPFSEYRTIMGLISDLQGSRSTFYAWDPGRKFPRYDPTGVFWQNRPQINSVNANMYYMSLRGLPANFTIARGDLLCFAVGYGLALHEVRSPAVFAANGAGFTGEFAVSPALRVGTGVNSVVNMYPASCEMMIVPGSIQTQELSVFANLAFDAIQVIL
jgi:hypothetical protein